MRFVKVDSLLGTLQWTYRSWTQGYCVPKSIRDWALPVADNEEDWDAVQHQGTRDLCARWNFLRPFFASHGYYLYHFDPDALVPSLPQPVEYPEASSDSSGVWPWTRVSEEGIPFYDCIEKPRIWPARNREGREVIIRLVSDGVVGEEELRVLERLNSPAARADPRNHTLPVLEYLHFDNLIFVAMPRWESCAFAWQAPAETISQLFDVAETFFEGLQFLHELRIAHRDFFQRNLVMNALIGINVAVNFDGFGKRRRGEVRYALIDWDASSALPMDADISTAQLKREMRVPIERLGFKHGMCNPFKDDVLMLTSLVKGLFSGETGKLGVAAGQLASDILSGVYDDCPSASEVLRRLRLLRTDMTEDDMNEVPTGDYFRKYAEHRERYPLP